MFEENNLEKVQPELFFRKIISIRAEIGKARAEGRYKPAEEVFDRLERKYHAKEVLTKIGRLKPREGDGLEE